MSLICPRVLLRSGLSVIGSPWEIERVLIWVERRKQLLSCVTPTTKQQVMMTNERKRALHTINLTTVPTLGDPLDSASS